MITKLRRRHPHDMRRNDDQNQVLLINGPLYIIGGIEVGGQGNPGEKSSVFMVGSNLLYYFQLIYPEIDSMTFTPGKVGQRSSPAAATNNPTL